MSLELCVVGDAVAGGAQVIPCAAGDLATRHGLLARLQMSLRLTAPGLSVVDISEYDRRFGEWVPVPVNNTNNNTSILKGVASASGGTPPKVRVTCLPDPTTAAVDATVYHAALRTVLGMCVPDPNARAEIEQAVSSVRSAALADPCQPLLALLQGPQWAQLRSVLGTVGSYGGNSNYNGDGGYGRAPPQQPQPLSATALASQMTLSTMTAGATMPLSPTPLSSPSNMYHSHNATISGLTPVRETNNMSSSSQQPQHRGGLKGAASGAGGRGPSSAHYNHYDDGQDVEEAVRHAATPPPAASSRQRTPSSAANNEQQQQQRAPPKQSAPPSRAYTSSNTTPPYEAASLLPSTPQQQQQQQQQAATTRNKALPAAAGGSMGTNTVTNRPQEEEDDLVTVYCVYSGTTSQRAKAVRVPRRSAALQPLLAALERKFGCALALGYIDRHTGDCIEVGDDTALRGLLHSCGNNGLTLQCWAPSASPLRQAVRGQFGADDDDDEAVVGGGGGNKAVGGRSGGSGGPNKAARPLSAASARSGNGHGAQTPSRRDDDDYNYNGDGNNYNSNKSYNNNTSSSPAAAAAAAAAAARENNNSYSYDSRRYSSSSHQPNKAAPPLTASALRSQQQATSPYRAPISTGYSGGMLQRPKSAGRPASVASHRALSVTPAHALDASGVAWTEPQLRELFEQLDTNADGTIDRDEMMAYYHANYDDMGVVDAAAKFEAFLDGCTEMADGRLSFEEFEVVMLKLAQW